MPGRAFSGTSQYRYGFNGQEKSQEIDAAGNSMTAEFWQYDARIGRRWNLDPKPTIGVSDYATFLNSPIRYNDIYGDSPSHRFALFLESEKQFKEVFKVDMKYAALNPQISFRIPLLNYTVLLLNYESDDDQQEANRKRTRKLNGGLTGSRDSKMDAHEAAYAMTKQGGGANNSKNIMELVPAGVNRSHGSLLRGAVQLFNIQDGDPIYVILIPDKPQSSLVKQRQPALNPSAQPVLRPVPVVPVQTPLFKPSNTPNPGKPPQAVKPRVPSPFAVRLSLLGAAVGAFFNSLTIMGAQSDERPNIN